MMIDNRRHISLTSFLLLLVLTLTACDRNVLFDDSRHLDGDVWNSSELMVFNVEVSDTSSTYLCCFDLRNTNDYPFSNIFLSLKTVLPDGAVATDTNLEFILAEPDGRWLGKQTGRYIDGRYPFGYLRFPQQGLYQFSVGHAMRDTLLPGVKDVGLHIENTDN